MSGTLDTTTRSPLRDSQVLLRNTETLLTAEARVPRPPQHGGARMTPTTANAASASSRRTATTTSEPMQDSAETLQAGASGVDAGSTCSITLVEATSTGKRTVGALDDASSPYRTCRCRGARIGCSTERARQTCHWCRRKRKRTGWLLGTAHQTAASASIASSFVRLRVALALLRPR